MDPDWNCIITGLGIVPPVPQDRTCGPDADCDCGFTAGFWWGSDEPSTMIALDLMEESWHHLRECKHCGHWWWGLHCPHDGHQNPCGRCGTKPKPVGWD